MSSSSARSSLCQLAASLHSQHGAQRRQCREGRGAAPSLHRFLGKPHLFLLPREERLHTSTPQASAHPGNTAQAQSQLTAKPLQGVGFFYISQLWESTRLWVIWFKICISELICSDLA